MKLLLDENLSPQLAELLADLYPGSEHVDNIGLGATRDGAIWNYAKAHGLAIVSKDSDFADRGAMEGAPPKAIWIRLGSCSTNDVEVLLRSQYEAIRRFLKQDSETCLLLGRGHS